MRWPRICVLWTIYQRIRVQHVDCWLYNWSIVYKFAKNLGINRSFVSNLQSTLTCTPIILLEPDCWRSSSLGWSLSSPRTLELRPISIWHPVITLNLEATKLKFGLHLVTLVVASLMSVMNKAVRSRETPLWSEVCEFLDRFFFLPLPVPEIY